MRIAVRIAPFVTALALVACTLIPRSPTLEPQEVTTRFFRWYIGYPGNPLADKEYRNSPYLAEGFIQEVDTIVASFDAGGYDPFLLAQDIPEQFSVGEATVADERANVLIRLYWGGNPNPSVRQVDLQQIGGEWKIVAISAVGP